MVGSAQRSPLHGDLCDGPGLIASFRLLKLFRYTTGGAGQPAGADSVLRTRLRSK